jgi:hypothetical protein
MAYRYDFQPSPFQREAVAAESRFYTIRRVERCGLALSTVVAGSAKRLY